MADIQSLLDGVIEDDIKELESLPIGDERDKTVRELTQLHKLRIEEIKAQTEADDKCERRAMDSAKNDADLALKEKQMQMQTEQNAQELALKEREIDGKDADRVHEDRALDQQARESKIDRCMRIGVAAAELLVPLAFYGIWMKQGFRFEESGSFTSTTFKNLLNRFRPTK